MQRFIEVLVTIDDFQVINFLIDINDNEDICFILDVLSDWIRHDNITDLNYNFFE